MSSFDGDGMYLSSGNTGENPNVGLLFIDFERPDRLRLSGVARVEAASVVNPAYSGAQFVLKVTVREVFPNCGRYVHRMKLVERSRFVPRGTAPAPVPAWKRAEWACDVLAADDPARAPER